MSDNPGNDVEYRDEKEAKAHFRMLEFVGESLFGIPESCPCGGYIIPEIAPTPKYPGDRDMLPGSRYFTCNRFKCDGLHYRQPWTVGVEEECGILRTRVKHLEEDVKNLRIELAELRLALGLPASRFRGGKDKDSTGF